MKDTTRDSGSIEPSEKPLETLFVVGALELRDYFAAHALAGMWAAPGIKIKGYEKKSQSIPYRVLAIEAYAQADAMLEARKQPRAE